MHCYVVHDNFTSLEEFMGDLFGLWPNISPDSTYAKSFIKLLPDEAEEGSLYFT